MRRFHVITVTPVCLALAACGGPNVETRTFELKYLHFEEAEALVEPYVFNENGHLGGTGNLLTVREAPANLEQIAQVLERYDREKPSVRLHFQIIRADGATVVDPEIADVESALRKLFRFDGYQLVAEALLAGAEGSQAQQAVSTSQPMRATFGISANIQQVRALGDSGTVLVFIHFRMDGGDGILQTGVNLRAGQTAVLGNIQPDPSSATIILTVRPEFVGP